MPTTCSVSCSVRSNPLNGKRVHECSCVMSTNICCETDIYKILCCCLFCNTLVSSDPFLGVKKKYHNCVSFVFWSGDSPSSEYFCCVSIIGWHMFPYFLCLISTVLCSTKEILLLVCVYDPTNKFVGAKQISLHSGLEDIISR